MNRPSKPYRTRSWVYVCQCCHQGVPVPSLDVQSICKEAGACPECMRNDFFVLKVRIAAIEKHMADIAAIGKTMPDDQRDTLRGVYSRKAQQLANARAQLAALETATNVEVPI